MTGVNVAASTEAPDATTTTSTTAAAPIDDAVSTETVQSEPTVSTANGDPAADDPQADDDAVAGEAVAVVEPAAPTTSTVPVEPAAPTTSTVPVEPTTSTTSTVPVELAVPTASTTSTVPVEPPAPPTTTVPVEPAAPTTSTVPVEPPAPTTTTAPVVQPPRPVAPVGGGDAVYLTFDDGPHPVYTPQMLDVLARYGARATFFVVGRLAEAYPDLIERIADEGHTIANHTWNHEDLAPLSQASFDETIGRTQDVLGDLATPCLRPPYGSVGDSTRQWAASHGLALVLWDSSPQDWLGPPAAEIADHIVAWARPGAVLLMHDGGGNRSATVAGLDMALERLADRDLSFEPVCAQP